jgi:hypothetical protein
VEETVVEKQVRVSIDIKFNLDEITEDDVKRDFMRSSNYEELIQDPIVWEIAERQNRLLRALLKDEELLNKFLTKWVVERFLESSTRGQVHSAFNVEEREEELIEPAIASLDEEDIAFFKDVIESGAYAENTEHIFQKLEAAEVEMSVDIL